MGKSGKRGSGRAAKAAKAGLFTLAIAAFVVVCTGIGKLHASPFALLAIEGASLASSDDAGTVVVDQGGTRLLFASPAGELRGLYGMAGRETPIDEVSLVRQVGNDVLVAGVKRAEDGERIKTEAVIRFDMSGTYKGVVWRRDYQDDEVRVTRRFRGATYRIHIVNRSGDEKGTVRLALDGKPLDGTLIPAGAGEHSVECVIE